MKHSFFVRRQLTLVVATIVVTSVLISLVFNMIARYSFMQQKADEFKNNALAVGGLYVQRVVGRVNELDYRFVVENNLNLWDARVAIFDSTGAADSYTADLTHDAQTGAWVEEKKTAEEQSVVKLVRPYVETVLAGHEIMYIGKGGMIRTGDIIVGVPIVDSQGSVLAAVFMTRRISELNTALNTFNVALAVSILGVLVVMLLPTYIGAKLLARPIYQMRDVALRMAKGDFSARANAEVRGEFGELAGTLNFLSEQLSFTIQELRLEKNRLTSIVDGLGEGILAVDARGEITHFNPALLKMFAPKALSVGAWDRTSLIPDARLWEDFEMTVRTRTPMIRDLSWNGAQLMVTISPLESESGQSEGAVGLFRDVTEQQRLEQTRRDYVANVSHELRTPVSSVRGLAEALKDGLIREEADRQRYYGYILRETMRLTRLIEDLLELSRLQSGTVALKKQRVDTRDLLLDFAERYEQSAEDVGIGFTLDVPENCPDMLTNPDRVEQVLVVLVDNAIKFTPSGGDIRVAVAQEGEFLRLSVRDSGSGIDSEDLPHVFERFYKADKSHSGHGTGLGLSIAHEIVQLLGGKMTVESALGEGSEFSFTVPIRHGGEA